MFQDLFVLLKLSLCTFACLFVSPVSAQVTTDGTVNTQVNTNGNVSEITGGQTRGDNLFHSFQDFSVPTNNEAFFNNADGIANIFSRVTGGNISNIDGLIRANGSASLFLINPAGILFGEGASLNIGGSFYGSTADSILFEDGEFSATDLNSSPLLTVNAPIGLGFRDNPGDITVRGNGNGIRTTGSEPIDTQDALRVGGNGTISIVGGNLIFEDATIKTAGGSIKLGSVREGRVDLVEAANSFSFSYSGVETFGDISLSGTSIIDASGNGGGNIQVAGRNITLEDSSQIEASTLGNGAGSEIDIFATDEILIDGVENENNFTAGIFNQVYTGATANAGDINIETGSLSMGDRSVINTGVSGQGNAGDINIIASESVALESQGNDSTIFSGVNAEAVGNGGNIDITTGSLTASNGAFVSVATSGQGNAGNIALNSDSLSLTNGSFFNANTRGMGNAGNISIDSANIAIDGEGNSEVSTGLFSNVGSEAVGNGGNVNITTGSFSASNGASINVITLGQGNAGNIAINSDSLSLTNGSLFSANTRGTGNAGNISIDSANIAIDGEGNSEVSTGLFSNVGSEAVGNGGNVDIATESFNLSNGGNINLASSGQGNGGNVTIDATENISFANDSGIIVSGAPGGSIALNAKNLSIASGSSFFAGINSDVGESEAQSGDIAINLTEDLTLDGLNSDNPTSISNSSFGQGNPGNIEIAARNITFQNGANIAGLTQEQETVTIGDITLNATGDIIFNGINSSSRSGIINVLPENSSGSIGDINVTAQNLTITNGAAISSQVAGTGDSGNINLDVANSIEVDGFGEVTLGDGSSGILPSEISSIVFDTGNGNAGTINIDTQNLQLSRNGSIDAEIAGTGNGGNININAEQITIGEQGNPDLSPSSISTSNFATLFGNTEGNGGNITINTGSLSLVDGGNINVDVFGVGDGGNITINARDTVSVEGTSMSNNIEFSSGISTDVFDGVGNAGDLEINTTNLSVADDATISAGIVATDNSGSIVNTGNGGSIIINASDSVDISSTARVQVDILDRNSTGNGGDLTIETQRLNIEGGAEISAVTLGSGDAGSLNLTASESINLSGVTEDNGRSGIFASALEGSGNGGDVNMFTDSLTIEDGAAISVSNFPSSDNSTSPPGTGQPGNLFIRADSMSLSDGGRIIATTQSSTGEGANITLQVAENISLQDESLISARAFDRGNGGNLTIDSEFIIAFPSSGDGNDIIASAEQGNGGEIIINSTLLGISEGLPVLGNSSNDISASSEFSLDGDVIINTPDNNLIQGTTELPSSVIEPQPTVAQTCQANREVAQNSFAINGKGGIPNEPGLPLNPDNILIGEASSTASIPQAVETSQGKIQLARGVKVAESGNIILTAYRTTNSGDRIIEKAQSCGQT